ncbi:MAG: hypothetical protein LRY66_06795 [Saccharospirillaceae bacterium]|nr:hypothetical protein [Saccharospirillaceae bacterium]MCD8531059.1 hypothetical protein [Saccharospirillaceae bacterium]
MKALWIPVLACLTLTGCPKLGQEWSDKEETLLVDYYKAQCDKSDDSLCFRIRANSSDSWETATVPLTGFSAFSWGNRYTLDVNTRFDSSGKASGYEFRSVKTATAINPADEAFALTLYSRAGVLTPQDASTWSLGGEIPFACGSYCAQIKAAVDAQYVLQLEFTASAGAITLTSLLCSASETDFSSDCSGESTASWTVAHFQSECGLADAAMCLLYRVNSSDDFSLLQLSSDINNFTPTWGLQYDLTVVKTLSSGGSISKVVLKENDSNPDDKANSTYPFKFILRGSALAASNEGMITGYDSTPDMNCSSNSLCSNLDGYIADDQWLLLKGYVDNNTILLQDIICHDDVLTDFKRCVADETEVTWSF